MSYIRPSTKPQYSKTEPGIYVYQGEFENQKYIEDYDALEKPEALCEVIFQILRQSGINFGLEEVNKVRNRMNLEELDEITEEKQVTQQFQTGNLEDAENE